MRGKEDANDYRYFPDPDLLPVDIDDAFIDAQRDSLPELPEVKTARYISDLGLAEKDAITLAADKSTADYFEALIGPHAMPAKLSANWMLGELFARLNKDQLDIDESPVNATEFAGLLARIEDNTVSGKTAKQVLDGMWSGKGGADEVIEAEGLQQITDTSAIEAMIDEVIAANPSQVEEYRAGKEKLIGFFVGAVMKASGGKANPGQLNQILKDKLSA